MSHPLHSYQQQLDDCASLISHEKPCPDRGKNGEEGIASRVPRWAGDRETAVCGCCSCLSRLPRRRTNKKRKRDDRDEEVESIRRLARDHGHRRFSVVGGEGASAR